MNIQIILNQYWQPTVFTFVVMVLLCLMALKVFPKLGLLDRPELYGLKRKPIPYYGGLVIFVCFLISVLVFVQFDSELLGLLVGSTLIVSVGFLDDKFGLSPWLRLFVQFVAACVLIFSGIGILSINIPFFGVLDMNVMRVDVFGVVFPIFGALFTIFWVMAFVNTMNFVDGISGLSSGVSFVAGMTMFLLSINPEVHVDPGSQVGVATISLIIAMISLGFLIFDFPRPKMLMGDSGSTFFGFVIACLAIFSGGKVATAFLVLGIPILDMVWVVLRRVLSGQKFWEGDTRHLHHRLKDFGFSERKVVVFYLIITSILGLFAVSFVSSQQKLFILIGLLVLMLLLAGGLVFLPKRKA